MYPIIFDLSVLCWFIVILNNLEKKMFEPFTYISDVELYMFQLAESQKTSDSIPKEYFEIFPPLRKYVFVKTPTCHYELLKQLLSLTFFPQQQNIQIPIVRDKKKREIKLIDVLNFFVSIMPQYPSGLGERFSDELFEKLSTNGKFALVSMVIKNPQLFQVPKKIDIVEAIINLSVSNIDNLTDQTINIYLNRIYKEYKGEANEAFTPLFLSLIESNKLLDRWTPFLLPIFKTIVKIGVADKILSCKLPSIMLPLKTLQPFSILYTGSCPSNNELFASLRVYCFAIKVVSNLIITYNQPDKQLAIILLIHRFLKSGYICVDAFIYAITVYGHTFWKNVERSKKNNYFLIAVAIANSLSCYELFPLKNLIQKYKKELIHLFSTTLNGCTDLQIKKTFTTIISALQFTTFTPLSVLIHSWTSKDHLPLLPFILSMDENDELFVPFVLSAKDEIIQSKDIYLPSEIARKLMLTGPSTAANFALKQLASSMEFMKVINHIFNFPISLFIPTMHLMTLKSFKFQFPNKMLYEPYVRLVMFCVVSESAFSLYHLEYLSNFLSELPNNFFMYLFSQMLVSNTRTFLRFLLFITNVNCFKKMITMPNEFDSFMKNLRRSLNPGNDQNNISVITIAWRNMVTNFEEGDLNNNLLNNLFQFGTNGLLMHLNKDPSNILIKAALCDVLHKQFIITKLSQKVKTSLKDKKFFIAALSKINEDMARREFPETDFKQLANVEVPVLPPHIWKHEGWAKFICSNIYLAPATK